MYTLYAKALTYAVIHAPIGMLGAYLKKGANPNITILQESSKGNTPLHFAVMMEKTDHIELLLEAGAGPDAVNEYGQKPLDMLPKEMTQSLRTYISHLFKVSLPLYYLYYTVLQSANIIITIYYIYHVL